MSVPSGGFLWWDIFATCLFISRFITSASFDCAYEHAFENEQTNASPGPPYDQDGIANSFGPGVTVKHSQDTVHFVVTYYYY